MVAVGTGHDAAVEGDLLALLGLCVCVCERERERERERVRERERERKRDKDRDREKKEIERKRERREKKILTRGQHVPPNCLKEFHARVLTCN